MTPLDKQIRQSLLAYPTLYATRWDVLRHLYIIVGNGYDWVDTPEGAVLKDVCSEPFDEAKARASFFRDIDDVEERNRTDRARYEDSVSLSPLYDLWATQSIIARKRRQFLLENVDLIVFEGRNDAYCGKVDVYGLCMMMSDDYSKCFTVPKNAEASFKTGAIEVLNELIPLLYHPALSGQDRGLRAKVMAQRDRLSPSTAIAMADLTRMLEET